MKWTHFPWPPKKKLYMDIKNTLWESVLKFSWSSGFKCSFIFLISSLFLYQASESLVTMVTLTPKFTVDWRAISSPRSLNTSPHLFILAVVQALVKVRWSRLTETCIRQLCANYWALYASKCPPVIELSRYTCEEMNVSSELLSATNLLY